MDVSVEVHTVATITSRTEAGLCKVAKREICASDSEALSMSLLPVSLQHKICHLKSAIS